MITLFELRKLLENYDKNKGYFETVPESIIKLQKISQKQALGDNDQFDILNLMISLQHSQSKSKAFQELTQDWRYKVGGHLVSSCEILIKNKMFTWENVKKISQHEYLPQFLLHLERHLAAPQNRTNFLTQDCIDLLILSASGEENISFSKQRTEYLLCTLLMLWKYELLDEETYALLYQETQKNIAENKVYCASKNIPISSYKVQTEQGSVLYKAVEWSNNISQNLLNLILNKSGSAYKIKYLDRQLFGKLHTTIDTENQYSSKMEEDHTVFVMKTIQLLYLSGILPTGENLEKLLDGQYGLEFISLLDGICGKNFISIVTLYSKNNLLNEVNFRNFLSFFKAEYFHSEYFAAVIEALDEKHLLTQEIINHISLFKGQYKEITALVNMKLPFKLTANMLEKILKSNQLKKIKSLLSLSTKDNPSHNPENFSKFLDKVIQEDKSGMSSCGEVLFELHQAGSLNNDSFNLALSCSQEECTKMIFCITKLCSRFIFTMENLRDAVEYSRSKDNNVENFIEGLNILDNAGILQKTKALIQYSPYPKSLAYTLATLSQARLLTGQNLSTITWKYEKDYGTLLAALQNGKPSLLNQKNFDAIFTQKKESLVSSMVLVSKGMPLTQKLLDILFNSGEWLKDTTSTLFRLANNDLLTEKNQEKLINHVDKLNLFSLLHIFTTHDFQGMTQTQFDNSLLYAHLISPHHDLLGNIPNHLFNSQFVDELFGFCSVNNTNNEVAYRQISQYIRRVVNPDQPDNNTASVLNYGQSTHAQSVHKSVSESAIKLKNSYMHVIQEKGAEKIKQEIKEYIESLTGDRGILDDKNSAAKRAMDTLSSLFWQFQDKVSQVTNFEILLLTWVAIHDDKKRHSACSLEDAKQSFVNGLYEVKRGYNLDDSGKKDDGEADRLICTGGGFNKMVQSLHTIHEDVNIEFITKTGATLKLQHSKMATEYIKEDLDIQKLSIDGLKLLQTQLSDINGTHLEDSWKRIRPRFAEDFSEYRVVFKKEKEADDQEFEKFIDSGFYTIDEDALNKAIETRISNLQNAIAVHEKPVVVDLLDPGMDWGFIADCIFYIFIAIGIACGLAFLAVTLAFLLIQPTSVIILPLILAFAGSGAAASLLGSGGLAIRHCFFKTESPPEKPEKWCANLINNGTTG
jgi:hypothetical protein